MTATATQINTTAIDFAVARRGAAPQRKRSRDGWLFVMRWLE